MAPRRHKSPRPLDGAWQMRQPEALPRIAPDAIGRVSAPEEHGVDISRALERMVRARKRQPRWWRAVDGLEDRDGMRAAMRTAADLLDPPAE
jgi:hypothetical protein